MTTLLEPAEVDAIEERDAQYELYEDDVPRLCATIRSVRGELDNTIRAHVEIVERATVEVVAMSARIAELEAEKAKLKKRWADHAGF